MNKVNKSGLCGAHVLPHWSWCISTWYFSTRNTEPYRPPFVLLLGCIRRASLGGFRREWFWACKWLRGPGLGAGREADRTDEILLLAIMYMVQNSGADFDTLLGISAVLNLLWPGFVSHLILCIAFIYLFSYIYVYIYICVWVCVERERERGEKKWVRLT